MAHIDDNILVSQLSIPGTHDSAAYSTPQWYNMILTPFWKTQSITISQQLNIGVRFLDLRIKCQIGQGLTLFHGTIYLGDITKAFIPIYQFLLSNPSQFLFVMFQKQQGNDDPLSCGEKIQIQLSGKVGNIIRYCYACHLGTMPTLKELRGKIWLLISDPGNNQTISLMGEYQVPTYSKQKILKTVVSYTQNLWDGPQNKKKNSIIQVINSPTNLLRINFLSQANFPSTYSQIYNSWLKDYFQQNQPRNVGIIVFDYITQDLAKMVYLRNF